jgi:hypothetical protein
VSTIAEDVLFLSLTDTDSIEVLSQVGLDLEAIPTDEMRPVVAWAIDQFFESGRTRAPTRAAMLATWGQEIEDAGVELLPEDEDADTIQWAISTLKAQFIHFEFQTFLRKSGTEMAAAPTPDKIAALAVQADTLFALSMRVQPRHMQVEANMGFINSLAAYEAREREGHITRGMTFGLPAIDEHTYGIHDGELAIIAAGPKAGKSFFLARAAKECWVDGKDTVLITLENAVQMTVDRIVCLHLGINSRRYQRGLCSQEEKDRVVMFINDVMPKMSAKLHVIMPEPGKRTMSSIVRLTQTLGSRRLFIDQLTFVEHPDPGHKARNEVIRDQMHDLKSLISTGNEPISCMLAHQINRAGMEVARKTGFMRMEDMAEGAEVERTADWVFGLYQGHDDRVAGEALLQVLAARREDLNAWKLVWQPSVGMVAVAREFEIDA